VGNTLRTDKHHDNNPLYHPSGFTPCTVIGTGNALAGDDGAGIIAVSALQKKLPASLLSRIHCATLSGDLFAVEEYLSHTERIIFIDAFSGDTPGELTSVAPEQSVISSASFHQTDIATVMHLLKKTGNYVSFPRWEIRGITILPPSHLKEGLSPAVEAAVNQLVTDLAAELSQQYGFTEEQPSPEAG
jgi:hydrogenase maturation protease